MSFLCLYLVKKVRWTVFSQLLLSRILSSALTGTRLFMFHVFVNFWLWNIMFIWTSCGDDPKLRVVVDTPEGCVLSRGTSTCWRKGVTGSPCSSTRGSANLCTWWGTAPSTSKRWGHSAGKQQEKDLRVLVDIKLNMSQKWVLVSKNCNGILSCTKRSAVSKLWEIILTLCSRLVRPHLAFSVQFWAPQ